jgi:hypothetical protein
MPRIRRDPDLRQRSRFPAGEAAQQPLPSLCGVSSGGVEEVGRKSSSSGDHGEKSFGGFFSDAGCPAVGICGADLSGEDCRRKKLGPTVERVAAGPHWEGLFLQRTTSALWRVGGAPPFWTFGSGKLNGDYLPVSVADNHALPIFGRHHAPVFLSRFLGCAVEVMAFEGVLGRAGLILQQIEVGRPRRWRARSILRC